MRADIERQLTRGLNGIGVKEGSTSVGDTRERVDGLDDASLVIGIHDAHKACVGLESGEKSSRLDDALGSDWQEGDFDATRGERLGGVEDCVVLDGRGDEVVAGSEDAEES